ncbi:DUF6279 family lipoprotein [Vibrio sp. H11]|uniref:DUF6279 family lipoprotein n=1 Tax=Vibrio sp. H11 TaxID=2565928 RepID=UPI0010A68C77|nr:DUF6279 family lipoprotein [Vibrio sp. H11]
MVRWIAIIITALVLTGCGAKFVYNNIDWFVIDYVEDYVELNSTQKALLSDKIASFSTWQQQEEMPRYLHQLEQLSLLQPDQFSPRQLDLHRTEVQQHYQRLVMHLLPDAYLLANTLSDAQIEQFMQGLTERQQEFAEKYRDTTQSQARVRYRERITDNLEEWFGSLSAQQEDVVSQWVNEMKVTTADWIAFHSRLRRELTHLFTLRHNEALFSAQLQALLFAPEQFYSPVLRAKFQYNQAISDKYLVEIVRLASDKQIAYFRGEINDWQQLVQELSADVGTSVRQPPDEQGVSADHVADAS